MFQGGGGGGMSFDPQMLSAILQGGAQSGQMDPEADQLTALIGQLRNSKHQGVMDSGRYKVAPGWGSVLVGAAKGAQQGGAEKDLMGIRQKQAGIRSDQNQRILEALQQMEMMRQQPQQPPAMNDPYQSLRMPMGA
ncbi:MAG TPA: hypothetical protein VGK56_04745 [Anaerolineales bacterium]